MKILSVDDSKMVHMVIAKALKGYGVTHLTAPNGEEGLATAAREKPDLILLDITMPILNGLETLTRLKADPELAATPVVMLTAEGGADTQSFAFEQGVEKYLTKPFTEDVLIACIASIVALPEKVA